MNGIDILWVCQFRQAAFADGNIQSAYGKRPYLLYKRFANVREPTWGDPLTSFRPPPKGLSHLWLVSQRSAVDLHGVSRSAAQQREQSFAQIDEKSYKCLKMIGIPSLYSLMEFIYCINWSCWQFETLRETDMTKLINTVREEFAFFRIRVTPASYKNVKTWRSWFMCLSSVHNLVTISFKLTRANCYLRLFNKTSIARWHLPSAFLKLKGMRVKQKRPWRNVNTALFPSCSAVSTCLFLQLVSDV